MSPDHEEGSWRNSDTCNHRRDMCKVFAETLFYKEKIMLKRIDKQTMTSLHRIMLPSHENERTKAICTDMDKYVQCELQIIICVDLKHTKSLTCDISDREKLAAVSGIAMPITSRRSLLWGRESKVREMCWRWSTSSSRSVWAAQ